MLLMNKHLFIYLERYLELFVYCYLYSYHVGCEQILMLSKLLWFTLKPVIMTMPLYM